MKKLNTSLLKYIIKTDFFILENKKAQNLKSFNLISNKHFNILDVIELNASLKQLIRLLQFSKKKNLKINIINFNRQLLKIFQNFYHENIGFIQNQLIFKDNTSRHLETDKISELFIFFNTKGTLRKEFLMSEINSTLDNFDTGKYKLFNNINSFKKLVVILNIIHNTLLNYKNK